MFNPLKPLLFVASWSLPSTDPAASALPPRTFRRASRKCPSLDAGVVPSHRPLGHLQQPGVQHVDLRAQKKGSKYLQMMDILVGFCKSAGNVTKPRNNWKKSWDLTHAQLTLMWQLQNTSLQKHRLASVDFELGVLITWISLDEATKGQGICHPNLYGHLHWENRIFGSWRVKSRLSNQATSSNSSHWICKAGYSTIIWPGLKCQFQQKKRSISTRTNSNEPKPWHASRPKMLIGTLSSFKMQQRPNQNLQLPHHHGRFVRSDLSKLLRGICRACVGTIFKYYAADIKSGERCFSRTLAQQVESMFAQLN